MSRFRLPRIPGLIEILMTASTPASITQIDPDEHLYRRAGESQRDLSPVERGRFLRVAQWLYERNALARRLIEIQRDFVLGEGLMVSSDDPKIDAVLKRHWKANDWPVKGEQRFIDLRLYGEAIWRVVETPGRGTVLLYSIDPLNVAAMVVDRSHEPVVIELNAPNGVDRRERLAVIRYDPGADSFAADDAAGPDGRCFYLAINKTATTTRGISDLFALVDYLDGADQLLWTQLERARIANSMVWDVSVDGDDRATNEEADKIRKAGPPKPGTVNVHSKAITWQAVTPTLGATENEAMARQLLRWTLGGSGLPEHFFAAGDQANRATASEMNEPVTKRMTAIQAHWRSTLSFVLRYQLDAARRHGEDVPQLSFEDPEPWRIEAPDMSAKDLAKLGAVISQMVVALREAEQGRYISQDTARAGLLNLLRLIGIDTDPQKEAEKIAKQARPPSDYDRTPPTGLAELVSAANAKANETATQNGRQLTASHELTIEPLKKSP